MDKECKCCEQINFYIKHMNDDYKEKLFAKISMYTWRKNQRAIKGEQCSTITSKAYDLKYCPTCGKKLKGE